MKSSSILLEEGDRYHHVLHFFGAGKRQDRLPTSTAPKGPKEDAGEGTPGGGSGLGRAPAGSGSPPTLCLGLHCHSPQLLTQQSRPLCPT